MFWMKVWSTIASNRLKLAGVTDLSASTELLATVEPRLNASVAAPDCRTVSARAAAISGSAGERNMSSPIWLGAEMGTMPSLFRQLPIMNV